MSIKKIIFYSVSVIIVIILSVVIYATSGRPSAVNAANVEGIAGDRFSRYLLPIDHLPPYRGFVAGGFLKKQSIPAWYYRGQYYSTGYVVTRDSEGTVPVAYLPNFNTSPLFSKIINGQRDDLIDCRVLVKGDKYNGLASPDNKTLMPLIKVSAMRFYAQEGKPTCPDETEPGAPNNVFEE